MSATTIPGIAVNGYKGGGSSATLRFFSDQDFTTSTGEIVKAGNPKNNRFYRDFACTVVGSVLTLPTITTIPTTTDSTDGPQASWTTRILKEDGSEYDSWLSGFRLPHTIVNPTWADIRNYNNPQGWQPPSPGISFDMAALMISQAVGDLNLADVAVLGRIETATAPLDPAHPKAVETGDPRLPGFVLHTSKYASLNAALTAIAALGGGTVVIDSSTPVSASVATTASIAVRFEGQGILTGTSKTVTFAGPFEAPDKRVFAAGVTAVFTGPTTVLKPHWFGATGGGTDQTAELQAAVDALPTKGVLLWPRGLEIVTTAPLRIWTRGELSFIRASGTYYSDALGGIKYEGPDDTQAVQIYNSYGILWDGIFVRMNSGSSNGQQGIDIDQFVDGTVIGGRAIVGQVTSNVTVRNCQAKNATNTSADAVGFRLAFTSPNNCEMIKFENCRGEMAGPDFANVANLNRGSAFQIGGGGAGQGGANARNIVFDRCTWNMGSYGIKAVQGDPYIKDCEGQLASIDIVGGNPITMIIQGTRCENGRQFYVGRGYVTMIGNEVANGAWNAAFPVIKLDGPGMLLEFGNSMVNESGITLIDADPLVSTKLISFSDIATDKIQWSNFLGGAVRQGSSGLSNFEYLSNGGRVLNQPDVAGFSDPIPRVGMTGGLGMFQRQGWASSVLATLSANLKQSFGATTHDVDARAAWETLMQLGTTAGGFQSEVKWNYYDPSSNTPVTLFKLLGEGAMFLKPVAFAALPATPAEGMIATITDSNTAVWGATIAGGGSNNVLGFYNGSNWKLFAA